MHKISLSIPEPCHEKWDQMNPVEKGKFCASCHKTVIDFTDKSDRELIQFFKQPTGSVCGRLQRDQLDRDILIPRKRIPWIKYFFQFSLPALLFSMKSNAQGKVRVSNDSLQCVIPKEDLKKQQPAAPSTKKIFSGKVMSENGLPIPYATVMLKGTNMGTITDSTGNFQIKTSLDQPIFIVSAIGYNTQETNHATTFLSIQLNKFLSGEVVVASSIPTRHAKKVNLIKRITDATFSNFSVFPNPITPNTNFSIQVNKFDKGKYLMEMINSAGDVTQTNELLVELKNQRINIYLKEAEPGIYFIRITNKQSGKQQVEKVLVN